MTDDKQGGAKSWPTLRRVLAGLGLSPFFAFDREKREALLELREVLDEIERIRARQDAFERLPDRGTLAVLTSDAPGGAS